MTHTPDVDPRGADTRPRGTPHASPPTRDAPDHATAPTPPPRRTPPAQRPRYPRPDAPGTPGGALTRDPHDDVPRGPQDAVDPDQGHAADPTGPTGWVAAPRALLDPSHPWHPAQDGGAASRAFAWLDLYAMAVWQPDGRGGLARGQVPTSARDLADRWGWSKSKVHRWLRDLVGGGVVAWDTVQPDGVGQGRSVLTLCHYDSYADGTTGPWDTLSTGVVGTPLGHRGAGVENPPRGTPGDDDATGPRGTPDDPGGGRAAQQHPTPVDGRDGTPGADVEKSGRGTPGRPPPGGVPRGTPKKFLPAKPSESVSGVGTPSGIYLPSNKGEGGCKCGEPCGQLPPGHVPQGVPARAAAPCVIRHHLHCGTDTVVVAGHRIGMGLELRQWDRLADRHDPHALNRALSLLRHPDHVADALPPALRDAPVTMAYVMGDHAVLARLMAAAYRWADTHPDTSYPDPPDSNGAPDA